MARSRSANVQTRINWTLLVWALLGSVLFAGQASAALTLSPATLAVPVGGRAVVQISGASGEIQAESKNTAVATVSLSNRTNTGATLTVAGVSAGSATVYVRDSTTPNISLPVTVTKSMTVSPGSTKAKCTRKFAPMAPLVVST